MNEKRRNCGEVPGLTEGRGCGAEAIMSLAPAFRSSGDLLADRRYDYAAAALADGDAIAAADLFEQAAEIAPRWAAAWFGLGEARERLGENEAAADAFRRAAACDAQDELGAALRLARLSGASPAAPPAGYVRGLFDQYAGRFDEHLRRDLAYRGPELLLEAIAGARAARGGCAHFGRVLDLGCGTGLMARALAPHFESIHGVDLSPRMVEMARASGFYDHAEAGDLQTFLEAQDAGSADLIVAADVFVYLGDLAPVFRAAAPALGADGLFAFTVQRGAGADYALGADLRYFHDEAYLRRLARENGLAVAELREASTRKDAGVDVPGLVAVFCAP